MLTVQDLLFVPHLHLSLLGGGFGVGREVSWVHISDLQDPWKWLAPGELLLTNGLGLPRQESQQVAFMERLDEIGVSGLAVGADMPAPAVPLMPSASDVADRLGMPLLKVPYAIPFSAIQQFVAACRSQDKSTSIRLRIVSQTYDVLRGGIAAGHAKSDIMARLGECLSCRLYLIDTQLRRCLLSSSETMDRAAVEALALESSALLPGVMRLPGTGVHSLVVPVPSEPGVALLVEPDGSALPELEVLQHVATIMGVLVAELRGEWRRKRRASETLLTRLLRREVDADRARAALARLGLDGAHQVVVAARGPVGEHDAEELFRWLTVWKVPALVTATNDSVLLLSDTPERVHFLVELLSSKGFHLGDSEAAAAVSGVPVAARQALWALGAAAEGSSGTVRFSDDSILLPRTFQEAELIVDRMLGTLISYDRKHSTELVQTLRAFLQHDGSWAGAASELNVHKQTLGYRLKRIEEVAGRSLKAVSDTSRLWFALRAHDYMNGAATAHRLTDPEAVKDSG